MKMKALKAWVARDENGSLYMFPEKPKKKSVFWHAPKVGYTKLNDSLFPEVQWSDEEPTEIELSIKNNMEKSKIKSAISFLCRFSLFVFFLSCTVVGILHVIQWFIWHTFIN